MRRVVGALLAAIALLLLAVPARAQENRPVVRVIQIGGLLDRVLADFWTHSIEVAETEHAAALVVQLDSPRSVLSQREMGRLVNAIGAADVPVAIWVGPARAGHVGGDNVRTLLAADVVGRAPGASIESDGFDARVQLHSPTLGDFLVRLDGRGGITIPSKLTRTAGESPTREPLVTVRFSKPSLTARTIHGVTSPGPAYALLVFGLLLAVLEFTTAGIGLAAATGAVFLVLAALGLGGLPVHWPAIGALIFAVFGFAVDVQAGAPRVWTAIGTASMLYGSLFLFRDDMSVPLVWILGVFGLTAAFVLAGLPSLIRARFSSPTIGREGFVGEMGTAVGELAPDGVVSVRGATWRARTNRATPIPDGGAVRVIGIDGLVLDVEPDAGGAKDYRERSKSST
jgi:membrane-bound serine protease (ClpP class)